MRPRSLSRRSLKLPGKSPPIIVPKRGLNESAVSFYGPGKRSPLLPSTQGVIRSSTQFAMSMENLLKDSASRSRALHGLGLPGTQVVVVRITENHGNPTAVSCSEIDVLGAKKTPLPVVSSIIEPGHRRDPNLSKLFDRRLIKSEPESVWEFEWPPQLPDRFLDIKITVRLETAIESLRIWPCALAGDKGIKHFQVLVDGAVVHEGELERDFGQVIPLHVADSAPSTNIKLSEFMTPVIKEETFESDAFGEYALMSCFCLQFDIHGSYVSTKKFGLSAIRVFDVNGEQMDPVNDAIILGERCGNYDFERVFSKDFGDGEDWTGDYGEIHPRVTVKFPMKTVVGAVEIVNMRSEYTGSNYSVKKMSIHFDGRLMWSGRLSVKGRRDADVWKPPSTFVFFLPDPRYKDKVMNKC